MELENIVSQVQFENTSTKILNYLVQEIPYLISKNKMQRDNKVLFICLDINEENIFTPTIKIAIQKDEQDSSNVSNYIGNLDNHYILEIPIKEKSILKEHNILLDYFEQQGKESKNESIQILCDVSQELNTNNWNETIYTDNNFIICISQNNQTNKELINLSVPYFKIKKLGLFNEEL